MDENGRKYDDRMANAVAAGNHLEILMVMRTVLAERFGGASARDSAGLARQLQVLTIDINRLNAGGEISDDRLAEVMADWSAE